MPEPTPEHLEIKLLPTVETLELVWVEGGKFYMGDDKSYPVSLSGYYIGKYPVTQAQWQAIMGKDNNPSRFKGPNRPVEAVNWQDSIDFIKKLPTQYDSGFHLPTEAQWEFAARGGNLSGEFTYAGSERLEDVGWYRDNSYGESKPVGLKLPNEIGLYDMSGNVWEWCADWYEVYPDVTERQLNPKGPNKGVYRVLRGGSWVYGAVGCRCSDRNRDHPDNRRGSVGFRVALSAPVQ